MKILLHQESANPVILYNFLVTLQTRNSILQESEEEREVRRGDERVIRRGEEREVRRSSSVQDMVSLKCLVEEQNSCQASFSHSLVFALFTE